jgi:hypothetical protein
MTSDRAGGGPPAYFLRKRGWKWAISLRHAAIGHYEPILHTGHSLCKTGGVDGGPFLDDMLEIGLSRISDWTQRLDETLNPKLGGTNPYDSYFLPS